MFNTSFDNIVQPKKNQNLYTTIMNVLGLRLGLAHYVPPCFEGIYLPYSNTLMIILGLKVRVPPYVSHLFKFMQYLNGVIRFRDEVGRL